jgi:uncharacterized membrane protein YozB (DUF420 family)
MAGATISQRRLPWLRSKHLLFAFIGAMMAYVLHHNERFLIDPADPVWNHYQPFKWWLLPHGMAGACALFLAPLQFSDRIRQRVPKVHRVVGRIYVACVFFVVAPLGAYIQYFEERMGFPRSFTIAAAVNAVLLMSTAATGFFFILKGKVQQHRQWMTRSYAVALVFFEVRLISGVLGLDDKGVAVGELVAWICLAFSIPVADMALQIQESWRWPSTVATTRSPSTQHAYDPPKSPSSEEDMPNKPVQPTRERNARG